MALADVVRTTRGHSLIKAISALYRRDEDVLPLKPGDRIRCSAYAHLCAREEVLCSLRGIRRKNIVEPDTNLIFLHGTALHWGVQNELLPLLGVLLGVWRCHGCGQTYGSYDALPTNLSLRPDTCMRCGDHGFTYTEVYIKDDEYHLHGHLDGLLRLPGLPGLGMLEVKSIGDRFFHEVRERPMIAHIIQVNLYFMLLGPDFKWAKVLYWNKGGGGLAALREHLVERDEALITTIKTTLKSIWEGVEHGTLPDRICATSTCPRAAKCSVTERCFEQADHVVASEATNG
jgi:hypothetical protein